MSERVTTNETGASAAGSGRAAVKGFGRRFPFAFSFIAAAAILLVTLLVNEGRGGPEILTAAATFGAFTVVVGLGQMFVITTGPGNIDLSVPSTIALSGAVAMTLMAGEDALILLGLAAALGTGFLVGAFNYLLIRALRIPPIIATLSSSFIIQSLAIVYGRGLMIKPPPLLAEIATGRVFGLPIVALVALALSVAMAVVLHRTVYGRSVQAIGQNIRAAGLAGVQVDRTRFATYALSAMLAALCGTLLAGFSGGASLNMGEEYLLASIAVVVVGGCYVAGGFSNVSGLWGAALFLYLLVTMLNTFGVGAGVRQVATGLIIIAVITLAGGPKNARG